VISFISHLQCKKTEAPWQLTQVKEVLLIIFKDLLHVQWASEIENCLQIKTIITAILQNRLQNVVYLTGILNIQGTCIFSLLTKRYAKG
jgi:hypothetical protein